MCPISVAHAHLYTFLAIFSHNSGLFYMPELWQNSGTFLAQNDALKPRPHPAKPLPFFWIKRKKGSKPHNVLVISERHSEVKWCTRKEKLQTKVEEKKSRHCTYLFTAFIRQLLTAYSNRWDAFRPAPAFVNQGVCGKSRHSLAHFRTHFWHKHNSKSAPVFPPPFCWNLKKKSICSVCYYL